jgi:hypothetical protein
VRRRRLDAQRQVRRNDVSLSALVRRARQLEQRPEVAASEPRWAATDRPQGQRKREVSVRPGAALAGAELAEEGLMSVSHPRHGACAGGVTTSWCGDGLVSPR